MTISSKEDAIRRIRDLANLLQDEEVHFLPQLLRLVALAATWGLESRLAHPTIETLRRLAQERKGRR